MRSRWFATIATLAFLASACGGTPSQPSEPSDTAQAPSPTAVSPTEQSGDDEHAGMDHDGPMMAMSAGEPAEGEEPDHRFEVLVGNHFEFRPATFEVAAGDVVTFEITNDGDLEHEFVLGTPEMQQQMAEEMGQMQDDGHEHAHADMPNAVTVHGGKTATLTWRFTEPGTVLIGCHIEGHYEAGMKGEVRVS